MQEMIEGKDFKRKDYEKLQQEHYRKRDFAKNAFKDKSKTELLSPEYEPISANTDHYLADSENQANMDNQLLLGSRDMQSLHSNEIDMPTTVAQSSEDLNCINDKGMLYSRQSYSPMQRSSNKYGVQLSNYEVETTRDDSNRSQKDYLDLDDKKNDLNADLEEYPDNPRWAVFFFVVGFIF